MNELDYTLKYIQGRITAEEFTRCYFTEKGFAPELIDALCHDIWMHHTIGDKYQMTNVGGKDGGVWSIAYYPLFGTYKQGKWVTHDEPRALIERPIEGGIDFREMPLRYLTRI